MQTLLIIDGMAVMYRCFYAVRGLTRSDGTPVNALLGFIRLLEQMVRQWQPTHWAVVWDGGLPERRTSICPEYKAQRPPMPDELRAQFPAVNDFLERRQVLAVRIDGEEADDVIASMAAAADAAWLVRVATGDKDMLQIVNARCRMVNVSGKPEEIGPDAVKIKTGVLPEQITDWLALIGDTADNISGVPGIGPKTAAKLLNEFGRIEGIFAELDKVPSARIRTVLLASRSLLERNRKMVTLSCDIPLSINYGAMARQGQDPERLLPFFREWELRDMQRGLEERDLFAK